MRMPTLDGRRLLRGFSALVALVFVFGPALALAAGVRVSTVDNRRLAPPPALTKGFDALDMVGPWATDRVAGRADAVQLKAWVDYHLLGDMPASGKVIRGKDGYLFLGDDFTKACANNAEFRKSIKAFLKLARIIEDSGRRAVFTVAPNKSAVVTDSLPLAVPTGNCATGALAQQNWFLEEFEHPLLVGVGPALAAAHADGRQPYPRTDTHWTSAGSAVFAQELARHLRPRLAEEITITPATTSRPGDLTNLLGLQASETQRAAELSTGGTVKPNPKYAQYDPQRVLYGEERWKTRPADGLVKGTTLILGDSFAYTALGNLRPLFAQGRFVWSGTVSAEEVIRQIDASDTVVIEVVQRGVGAKHLYTDPAFRAQVARALDVEER